MKKRVTRIAKIIVAILLALLFGMAIGLLTTVNGAEPTDILSIETHIYSEYTFTPDGYFKPGEEVIPHNGTYLLYGTANRLVSFTSNGEKVTYNVILHNWQAVEDMMWDGIISVDKDVTLNITVYGDCSIVAYGISGIALNGISKGENNPIVNLTVMENSKITVGHSNGQEAVNCINDNIEFNLSEGASASVDMTNDDWRSETQVTFSKGNEPNHEVVYTYVDDESCYRSCSECSIMNNTQNHEKYENELDTNDENYRKSHEIKCLYCENVFGSEAHTFIYRAREKDHIAWCSNCPFMDDYESHTLDKNGCTVCKQEFIATHTVGDKTTNLLTFDGIVEALKLSGGTLKLLSNIENDFGNRINIENEDATIDLSGFAIKGATFSVELDKKLTIIDTSVEKTGKIIQHQYGTSSIYGDLYIEGAAVELFSAYFEKGSIILKDIVSSTEITLNISAVKSFEIINMVTSGTLQIITAKDVLEKINIRSGSFEKIKTGSYGTYKISVNSLLPSGYAYSGADGVLDGSKTEINNVISIVEHASHTDDAYLSSPMEHWKSCKCGYYPEGVEKELHKADENKICSVCKSELVVRILGETTGEMYFTTFEEAFEKVNENELAFVELHRDYVCESDIELNVDTVIQLDLNGCRLQLNRGRIYVYNRLTILDKSDSKAGALVTDQDDSYLIELCSGGELNIKDGEFRGYIYTPSSSKTTNIYITGGHFKTSELFRLSIGTNLEITGGTFECEELVFNLMSKNGYKITIKGGIFINSRLFNIDNMDEPLTLDSVLYKDPYCSVVLASEYGNALTIDDVSKYYEGTIVAIHEGSQLESDEEHHWYRCEKCTMGMVALLKHTPKYEISQENPDVHTVECTVCKYIMGTEEHSGKESTCTEKAECDKCNSQYGDEPEGHKYDNACDPSCNVCNEKRTVENHKYDNACDPSCNVCNEERTVEDHKYDNPCDTSCNICKAEREVTHSYLENGECAICKAIDPSYAPPQNGLSTGAIVGIVVGTVFTLALGTFVTLFIIKKKR